MWTARFDRKATLGLVCRELQVALRCAGVRGSGVLRPSTRWAVTRRSQRWVSHSIYDLGVTLNIWKLLHLGMCGDEYLHQSMIRAPHTVGIPAGVLYCVQVLIRRK